MIKYIIAGIVIISFIVLFAMIKAADKPTPEQEDCQKDKHNNSAS